MARPSRDRKKSLKLLEAEETVVILSSPNSAWEKNKETSSPQKREIKIKEEVEEEVKKRKRVKKDDSENVEAKSNILHPKMKVTPKKVKIEGQVSLDGIASTVILCVYNRTHPYIRCTPCSGL